MRKTESFQKTYGPQAGDWRLKQNANSRPETIMGIAKIENQSTNNAGRAHSRLRQPAMCRMRHLVKTPNPMPRTLPTSFRGERLCKPWVVTIDATPCFLCFMRYKQIDQMSSA